MGKYDNIPVIEGRFDATGRKIYWNQGYFGQGVKVAVIDDFSTEHGHQMASIKDYIAPQCGLIRLDMRGDYWTMIDKIKEATKLGVNIMSISRSVDFETAPLYQAIKDAVAKNILIFCSAGNSGESFFDSVDIKRYPAYYQETISVMSIENNYTFSKSASHNKMADVTGFGQNILVKNSKGEEMLVSGTSPTTAICAFTAALHVCKIFKDTGEYPTYGYMMNFIKTNVVDMGEVGRDNFFGYGFFTLDKEEWKRVKLMILDMNKDGLEDRVGEIKSKIASGLSYEEAERQVSMNYHIIGYEVMNGIKIPMFGGKKQTW